MKYNLFFASSLAAFFVGVIILTFLDLVGINSDIGALFLADIVYILFIFLIISERRCKDGGNNNKRCC